MGPPRRVRARGTTGAQAQNRGSIRGVAGLPSPLGQSQSSSSSSMALGATGVPSPLGQSQSSSSSPIALGGVQAFSSTLSENNLENSGSSSNASHRKWTSAVWEHYVKYDGKNFDDGIPRAVCMYCKGGPMLADSDWEIEKKVFTVTLDNARCNDNMQELDEGTAEDKSNFIKAELYNLFDEYVQRDPSTVTSQPQSIQDELPGFAAFADNVRRVSSTQLDMYLDEARVSHTLEIDVLSWWRENEQRFPKVADMAKDILAIPVTTVASESAFSMGSRLITRWRSSLKPETADALLTTRTWLYGFEVKEATNENQMLDGFEYEFSTLQINEAEVDDEEDDDHELV